MSAPSGTDFIKGEVGRIPWSLEGEILRRDYVVEGEVGGVPWSL
jgi:hypothetical protein